VGRRPERDAAEAQAQSATPPEPADHALVAGHRATYAALVEAARATRPPGAALVATGHAYVAGGALSELSERKIQQGHQQALPSSLFPSDLAYVALGHLHLAQRVGEAPEARYAGSPIPLSMAEQDYPHQVALVDLEGARLREVRPARVPRFVELLRVPREHAPLAEVLPQLEALPREPPAGAPPEARPLLEVRVALPAAEPRLRQAVEAALEGAWPRLVKIDVLRPAPAPGSELPSAELGDLAPEEVFRAAHRRARGDEPGPDLLAAFRELLEAAEHEAP
jgi:exonuclease SbcD